jgi:hypothetical protein
MWWTYATPQKGTAVNLGIRCSSWGAAKRGRDAKPHATSLISFASSPVNTGDSPGDAKSSGEVVRGKRLTKARCPRGESDGAE